MMSPSDPTVIFTLSQRNFRNTVISGPNKELVYYIETKQSMFHHEPTFIYRQDEGGDKVLVAKLAFRTFKADNIVLSSGEQKLEEFLPKKGKLNAWVNYFSDIVVYPLENEVPTCGYAYFVFRDRLMWTSSGEFTWKLENGKPKVSVSSPLFFFPHLLFFVVLKHHSSFVSFVPLSAL